MRLACSTQRKPACAARVTLAAVYAWPVTYRPALVASSTNAASSSREYCSESSRSVGELIPPETITLRKWAPRRSSSRAASRTASTPSAIRDSPSPPPACRSSPASERPVPAGLADRVPAEEQPRTRDRPVRDRRRQPGVGAAGVPDRGEPAVQHRRQQPRRLQRRVRRRPPRHAAEVGVPGLDVHVRVDEPGQDRTAADVGSLRAGLGRRAGGPDVDDPVAVDDHLPARDRTPGQHVHDRDVIQNGDRHRATLRPGDPAPTVGTCASRGSGAVGRRPPWPAPADRRRVVIGPGFGETLAGPATAMSTRSRCSGATSTPRCCATSGWSRRPPPRTPRPTCGWRSAGASSGSAATRPASGPGCSPWPGCAPSTRPGRPPGDPARPVPPDQLPDRPAADDPAEAAVEAQATREALALIATLPPDQAEVVALRVIAGLDAAQVGEIVGKRAGTVRVLAHRGLRRLAQHLAERTGV